MATVRKILFSFQVNDDTQCTTGATNAQFNNYKHGDNTKLLRLCVTNLMQAETVFM
jgi:hypothetical protein